MRKDASSSQETSSNTNRILSLGFSNSPLLSRARFILQFQCIKPFLAILGYWVDVIGARSCVCSRSRGFRRRRKKALLPQLCLFSELLPSLLPCLLAFLGTVLLLVVFMRTVIKKLWVYFHKQFHDIVYHAVDRPERRGKSKRWTETRMIIAVTYLFQCPFEFS